MTAPPTELLASSPPRTEGRARHLSLSRLLGSAATATDRVAIALLVALPALINLPFALAGRPLMGGDNLVQNYPLRVLSGQLIAHGRLPLWNPDIWSGAPLLAGWNAGALFPGTWLFALLPGVAAWEVNVIAVGVVGGVGMHVFLRRQGCSPIASLLAALTFSYAGFMSGQSVHIGLVTGMAIAPWILIALDQLASAASISALFGPTALLGVSGGLVVLAGDPRAISNDAIAAVVFLAAVWWRAARRGGAGRPSLILGGTAAGIVLAVALSAGQWLPGLNFLHQSQRASASLSYFGSYSLSGGQLSYLFTPFLFGGNGSLGLPTTNFNLPEYTYSVGILPMVALFALTAKLATRWFVRRSNREATKSRGTGRSVPIGAFIALFVIGVVLATGTKTPLGHLLVHVPLYGGERLQNRNMGIADLALCVVLAVFIDRLGEPADATTAPTRVERVAGAIPPLVVIALVAAMLIATASTERFLGATALALGLPDRMAAYYAFEVVVALAALSVAVRARWRNPARRRRMAIAVVGADLVMFVAMASYQLAPSSALARSNPITTTMVGSAGGTMGREAILDPQQLPVAKPANALADLGVDDLIVLRHLTSAQGYGSAVAGAYESATGAHEVENLRPSTLLTPTFDELDLRVIATLPELFGSVERSAAALVLAKGPPRPEGTSRVDEQPGDAVQLGRLAPAGPWRLGASESTAFELPGPLAIDAVALRFGAHAGSAPTVKVAVVLRSGVTRSFTIRTSHGSATLAVPSAWVIAGGGAVDLEAELDHPSLASLALDAVAVHTVAWRGAVPLSSGAASPARSWFELDGMLQGLLSPSSWGYQTHDGDVLFYRNLQAFGQAWLQPAGSVAVSQTRVAGSVTTEPTAVYQDAVDNVSAPHGALLVRSESYAAGWSVQAVRQHGPGEKTASLTLPVVQVGLLQGVALPPGRWIVTWRYRSDRATIGIVLGAIGVLVILILAALGAQIRRRRRPDGVSSAAATGAV